MVWIRLATSSAGQRTAALRLAATASGRLIARPSSERARR